MWKEVDIRELEIGDKIKVTGMYDNNAFTDAGGTVSEVIKDDTYASGSISVKFGDLKQSTLQMPYWFFRYTDAPDVCTFWVYTKCYTIFNKDETKHLLGKAVEASDDGIYWSTPFIFTEILADSEYPFGIEAANAYRFIREIRGERQDTLEERRISYIEEQAVLEILKKPSILKIIRQHVNFG